MRAIVRGIGVVVMVLMAGGSAARAQGIASSLRELQLLVRAGETVTVTDTEGREVHGRIEALTPAAIVVSDRTGRHEWTDAEVSTIRQRRSDSLGNGALIGLATGAGIGLVGIAALAEGDEEPGLVAVAALFYGGLGAGIGVGVDAMIRRESVIYHGATPRAHFRVIPMLTPARQGLLVSIGF
jgi:hypothetical protein